MRRLLPTTAAAVLLALSACGTDTNQANVGEETGTDLDCTDPPALPSDVPSFSQDELPAPHDGDPATATATITTTCGDLVVGWTSFVERCAPKHYV